MSGFTFVEKALARAAGVTTARAGDVLDVRPDVILSHDNSAAIRRIFDETGAKRVACPQRLAITLDHAVPAPTTLHAQNHAEIRAFVAEQGIDHFFEVGRGICHQVLSEEGLVLPGDVVLGADSHTTHFGWLGAFGMGIGRTEVAALWARGELWLRVPEAVQIHLHGRARAGVTAKDIALHILKQWGADGGAYRSLEFTGDGLRAFSDDDRAVIPNMMAEFGAMNAYFPPDEVVFRYLAKRARRPFTPLYPDQDAVYSEVWHINTAELEPLIALPHAPDHVVPLRAALGQPIHQAFLGTCTNGRYSDLAAAADVLRGRQLRARMIVIPASAQVLQRALQTGVLETLIAAGATIGTPGCGPCMGNHMGIPAPNEATISSANRNYKGRMGTPDAPIYLANPYVVAASAVTGCITDPQTLLNETCTNGAQP